MDQVNMVKLCTVEATLDFKFLGKMPVGTRVDIGFSGVATGSFWEGEREVVGMDYTTSRADGNLSLDIRATIGTGRETVDYCAVGVGVSESQTVIYPHEVVTFQTANDELNWLNNTVGVIVGKADGTNLTLNVFVVASPER